MPDARLLLTRHRNRHGFDARTLQRGERSGKLIRLRCGAFVATDVWKRLSWAEQRRLEIQAAAEMLGDRFIASHRSAAVLLGIPVLHKPDEPVHLRATVAAGTRTEHGYRKHAVVDLEQHTTVVDGIRSVGLERTVLDVAATGSFADGVVAADWALAHGATRSGLLRTLDEWAPARGRRRVERAVLFADARSGSPGESWSRAQMEEGGLVLPELQTEFTDRDGLIGFVDFYWPEVRHVGEFDGLRKYRETELLAGRTPGEVVEHEKHREDRLRASERKPGVSRWIWQTLLDRTLVSQLRTAGVPRR